MADPSSDEEPDDEHTLSDTDQTLSDIDQTGSDLDQLASDRDQVAADRDQAASDRDLAAGVDVEAYASSREIRQDTAHERERTSQDRLVSADQRDAVAHARDAAARARDLAATARDLAMAHSDAQFANEFGAGHVTGAEIVIRAAAQRRRAAEYRARAAEHRSLAAEDRDAGARDRAQAARDRQQAHADRESLAMELAAAETDPLTGARIRSAGLRDLDRDLDRCRRTDVALVVAYVDVIGLKALNDSAGHAAGDALLTRLVALIKAHLRSYDLVIRLGGDEFLCAMADMTLSDARTRFGHVANAIVESEEVGGIRTGFAELDSDETTTDLIARADHELITNR